MTHFSDQIRVGKAGTPGDPTGLPMPNGLPFSGGGIYGGPQDAFAAAIDTVPIATFSNNLATAQTVSGANWVLSTGTGITTTSINGVTYFDQGWDRSLLFLGAATTATATLITVTGKDNLLRSISCTFTGPVSTNVIQTKKTFRYVAGAFSAGNTGTGVSIGTGDTFAFQHVCSSFGYLTNINWSGNVVTASTGYTVPDVTNPATSGTGDVRGTFQVPTLSSNGVARLTIFQYLSTNSTLATVTGLYGITPA